jgi:2-phospho-L-lactate guanylyltransferase (CobY/MobA/RfbA family)
MHVDSAAPTTGAALFGIARDSLFAMATFVVPFRPDGKTRLGDRDLAWAMFLDVQAACAPLGDVIRADAPGGQGAAVAAALARLTGPVAIVNADLPSATTAELALLLESAPALVAALDGTTNAIALADARDFEPLYGPGSADRFGLRRLDLLGLRDDVDTWDDLMRIADRVGPNTRRALEARVSS